MANYLAARIHKPIHNRTKAETAKTDRPRYIIGFDSEADTRYGRPMLFQFSLPGTTEDEVILYEIGTKRFAPLFTFLRFIDTYCTDKTFEYLIYGWNLPYEFTQIWGDFPEQVIERDEFIIENLKGWHIEVVNAKRHWMNLRKERVVVKFRDGTAFYKTSLNNAAKMLGVGEKYEAAGIDRKRFTREDLEDEDFLRYSRRDAFITRLVGEYIARQHDVYQIKTTLSAPHFAATVFRTHFLKNQMAYTGDRVEQAGLYSYHGGKNGFYLDGPADFPHIWQYDITSAYPEAMAQLPDIEKMIWNKSIKLKTHGLYYITGEYQPCIYEALQNHDGTKAAAGRIEGIWTTSYELKQLLDFGEFRLHSLTGFECSGPEGGALSDYVARFFAIKKHAKGPERETAKLLLNSLYGKFFQKQPLGSVGTYDIDAKQWRVTDAEVPYDYQAGGLYNPAVASLITGYVRGKIHRLEHKYQSVMTSTDGFFGTEPPDPNDLGTNLGELTSDSGRLRIWRERLYIFDSDAGKRKVALHGFRNTADALEQIPLASGKYQYLGTSMITLKMSLKEQRGSTVAPGQFVSLNYNLDL